LIHCSGGCRYLHNKNMKLAYKKQTVLSMFLPLTTFAKIYNSLFRNTLGNVNLGTKTGNAHISRIRFNRSSTLTAKTATKKTWFKALKRDITLFFAYILQASEDSSDPSSIYSIS
jgi:hypothetical protein